MIDFSPYLFARCADAIAQAGRELSQRGWTPVTSSNFSMRLSPQHLAITVSGRDKGMLSVADIMAVDLNGKPLLTEPRSSAETLLHCHIYRRCPEAGVVLHTHSLSQTVASRLYAPTGRIELAGYELLKAFAGLDTHETRLDLPVFPNSQDMQALVAIIDAHWASTPIQHGYLIDGHGIYAWGRDMLEAMRHLDAFDYLIRCELELRKLSR